MHARFLRLRRQPAPAIPRTYRRRHPLQPRAKRPPRIVRGNAAGCPDRQSAAAAAPKHCLLDQMERVAFLLHGTFEGAPALSKKRSISVMSPFPHPSNVPFSPPFFPTRYQSCPFSPRGSVRALPRALSEKQFSGPEPVRNPCGKGNSLIHRFDRCTLVDDRVHECGVRIHSCSTKPEEDEGTSDVSNRGPDRPRRLRRAA